MWMISTPEYYTITPQPYGDMPDPGEIGADVVLLETDDAMSRRDVRALGVRALRRAYPNGWLADAESPFAGLCVERLGGTT
jgi:hypothetical protein